jgi:hypothetical protein
MIGVMSLASPFTAVPINSSFAANSSVATPTGIIADHTTSSPGPEYDDEIGAQFVTTSAPLALNLEANVVRDCPAASTPSTLTTAEPGQGFTYHIASGLTSAPMRHYDPKKNEKSSPVHDDTIIDAVEDAIASSPLTT